MIESQPNTTISKDEAKAYVANNGAKCPKCGNTEIEAEGSIESDGGIAWQKIACLACEATWDDIYSLTGVEGR